MRRPRGELVGRLGAVLREIRRNSGLTQADLAARAGMSANRWARIERCHQKDIGLLLFVRVAGALGLSGTQLLAIVERQRVETPSASGN